eukprot:365134-Chlamydomonas_euryale.AAC.5
MRTEVGISHGVVTPFAAWQWMTSGGVSSGMYNAHGTWRAHSFAGRLDKQPFLNSRSAVQNVGSPQGFPARNSPCGRLGWRAEYGQAQTRVRRQIGGQSMDRPKHASDWRAEYGQAQTHVRRQIGGQGMDRPKHVSGVRLEGRGWTSPNTCQASDWRAEYGQAQTRVRRQIGGQGMDRPKHASGT